MTSGSKLFCVCIFLILNLLSLYALAQPGGEVTDLRDGQTYGYVQIGDQAWMAENLNYESPDSWCYDNVPENCSSGSMAWGLVRKISVQYRGI